MPSSMLNLLSLRPVMCARFLLNYEFLSLFFVYFHAFPIQIELTRCPALILTLVSAESALLVNFMCQLSF